MAAKLIFWATLLALGFHVSADEQHQYSPAEYFKNYALSSCIADGFSEKGTKSDAAAAASGYLELGEYPLEAHTEATQLARKFLTKEYKSYSGSRLILMKCIDFYHSSDLDALTQKYLTQK